MTAPTRPFIASLGVRNFDLCVVAIGDDFQSSLETTALLKEYGAPFVLARAGSRDVHAKFLLRNGADDVVYPGTADGPLGRRALQLGAHLRLHRA